MNFGKSGQHCGAFGRNWHLLTYLGFLGQVLISLVLIASKHEYSLISAAAVTNEYTTEYTTEVTEEQTTAFNIIFDANPIDMDPKLTLVKELIAENSEAEIFQGLAGAADQDFVIGDSVCYIGGCSFRVAYGNTSFIVKQQTTVDDPGAYSKSVNDEFIARTLQVEYKALEQRSGELPGLVPKPYLLSLNHSSIVMEDYNDYVSLKSLLTSGQISEETLDKIAVSVVALHNKTINKVDTADNVEFQNNPLTKLLLKGKFTQLFSNDTVEKLKEAGVNYTRVEKLGSQEIVDKVGLLYANLSSNESSSKQVVMHGLLNADDIIVRLGEIMLLGNQFALVGPPSFDVGTLLAQYLATYHIHMLTEQDNDAHRQVAYKMINASTAFVNTYLTGMGITEEEKSEFVSAVAGFTGVELVCMSITEPNRSAAEAIFDSGMRLIEASYRIQSAEFLCNIALMLTH